MGLYIEGWLVVRRGEGLNRAFTVCYKDRHEKEGAGPEFCPLCYFETALILIPLHRYLACRE